MADCRTTRRIQNKNVKQLIQIKMNKLTAQELKEFATKEENVRLMQTLFEAIAFSDTITAIVEKKSTEILAFYQFKTKEVEHPRRGIIPSEVILDHNLVYRLEDADFNLYFKEMNKFYQSEDCPIKPTREGNCPALESQSLVRSLKIQIADFFAPTLGINYDQISSSLKFYDNYYDLIMRMFSQQIKPLTV